MSNALYALGELLGSHDAQVSAGSGAAGPGGPGGPLHQQQNPHHLHRLRDAGVAAAHSPRCVACGGSCCVRRGGTLLGARKALPPAGRAGRGNWRVASMRDGALELDVG